jgi:KaiC/GvpD/RAD55 family RecA-like ATPase
MVERVTSGVPGFDELVNGGIPTDSVTLVTGNTGSGKTTFCTQFLLDGVENGESCLFITTEELPDEIKADAESFGWDLAQYEDDGSLRIEYIDPSTRSNYIREDIEKIASEMNPDRIVIDSVSVIGAYWPSDDQLRSNIHHLVKGFRELDSTVLITAEIPEEGQGLLSRYGIAEFVVDGVIALGGLSLGEATFRSLQVIKMRQTEIKEDVMGLNMTDDGVVIEEEDTF